jgi:hypothetical protein
MEPVWGGGRRGANSKGRSQYGSGASSRGKESLRDEEQVPVETVSWGRSLWFGEEAVLAEEASANMRSYCRGGRRHYRREEIV